MRHTTPALAVAVALLALPGCSNTEPGEASAAPAPESSVQPSDGGNPPDDGELPVPNHGAPKVNNPLDTTAFQQAPCSLLTPEQVTELLGPGVNGEPKIPGVTGPTCTWAKAHSNAQLGIAFPQLDDGGLSSVYGHKDSGLFVELAPAHGYPVVGYGTRDRRSTGDCSVRVGTSDRETIDIGIDLSAENVGKTDPCEAGRDIAETVIGNIKAAN